MIKRSKRQVFKKKDSRVFKMTIQQGEASSVA